MGFKDMPRKKKDGPAQIIALMNQKGGVGKTTTAINLAVALGELGYKVLVIDFDPQGNTTSGFGIDKNASQTCIYDAILCDEPIENVIVDTQSEGVFITPATLQLAGAEVELVSVIAREMRLRDALANIHDDFDYIFIDCPPSLGVLTINALVAATSVLVPIQCEFYALEGVTKLLESMKMVKSRINRDLDVFGVLLTMFDGRTLLSKQVAAEVEEYFGDKVFKTMIPRNVRLSEAPSYGMSVLQFDSGSKGAQAYRDLAIEVTQRG